MMFANRGFIRHVPRALLRGVSVPMHMRRGAAVAQPAARSAYEDLDSQIRMWPTAQAKWDQEVPDFRTEASSSPSPLVMAAMQQQVLEGVEDPFFVTDLNDVAAKYRLWMDCLPRVLPYYAVKCNPDPRIVETLAQCGASFDCASPSEIDLVLAKGVHPDRILYANPCKAPLHLRHAAGQGVDWTVFDSEDELVKVAKLHKEAKLLLRIQVDNSQARCVMSSKYGAPMDQVPGLLATAKALGLNVCGVSYHVGSACFGLQSFTQAPRAARRVFDVAASMGIHMDVLDIGGGFPGDAHSPLPFPEIASHLGPLLDNLFPASSGVQLVSEPGRFFVSSSQTLAVSVIGRKNWGGAPMYFVNDGLYGSFNCILYDHATVTPKVLPARGQQAPGARDVVPSSLWGPTCDGLDCISKEVDLPSLQVGDWLYFEDMGAYTGAAGSNFNGMPLPESVYLPDKLPANKKL